MKIYLSIFSKIPSEEDLKNLATYNKTSIVDRKSFKNFIIAYQENKDYNNDNNDHIKDNNNDNNLLFKIIFQYLRLVVSKYENKYNPKDGAKNYLIVEPIILEVFKTNILKMFKDKTYLCKLL